METTREPRPLSPWELVFVALMGASFILLIILTIPAFNMPLGYHLFVGVVTGVLAVASWVMRRRFELALTAAAVLGILALTSISVYQGWIVMYH